MKRIIGMMSGTSRDGLDIVCCELENNFTDTELKIVKFDSFEYPNEMAKKLKLLTSGEASVADIAYANVELAEEFAKSVNRFIEQYGLEDSIDLIVSHGQTVFHDTEKGDKHCTLQIGDGDYIAYLTGIPVLSDLRMKDMAAGGQGAPLVVYTDYILFSSDTESVAMQNIGGIGNVTFMEKGTTLDRVKAFDTGPGNVLINWGCWEFFGEPYDKDGKLSEKGDVIPDLLKGLWEIERDYFIRKPPKTTGSEIRYNQVYFSRILELVNGRDFKLHDIVRTLLEFTVETIAESYSEHIKEPDILYVTGGGALNPVIMSELRKKLPMTNIKLPNDIWITGKEAVAFAVMGNEYLHRHFSNASNATGAERDVILGKFSVPL